MLRSVKSIRPGITLIFLISVVLTGCYTQLSRPRVDTEDEYYDDSENKDVEVYDQDEGAPPAPDDARDVYIYNYWDGYHDWYPYRHFWRDYYWSYMGPYPHYWWDPYSHWWSPGWYTGYYYYDYWWGGYSHYNYPYYRYRPGDNKRTYEKQPFLRRSSRLVDRRQRAIDNQMSLAKPQSPTRMERSRTKLANPTVRDNSSAPERQKRPRSGEVNRTQPGAENPNSIKRQPPATVTRPRAPERKSEVNAPRAPQSHSQPRIIEAAPPKSRGTTSKESNAPPQRSPRIHDSGAAPNRSQASPPKTSSYTPRTSQSSSSASVPRSSSSANTSRSSSSGSSKKSRE